jgi:hypothetical protein
LINAQRPKRRVRTMFIVIGRIGSDAGYTIIDSTGVHHVGGWGVDSLQEFVSAVSVMRECSQLKTPGMAETVAKSVYAFAEGELRKHLGERAGTGDTVVIVA